MLQTDVDGLKNQLQTARNEINKLRQQVKNLQCKQRKDVEELTDLLKNVQCDGCAAAIKQKHSEHGTSEDKTGSQINWSSSTKPHGKLATINVTKTTTVDDTPSSSTSCSKLLTLPTIGVIRTEFPEKRAVPRQASIAGRLRGVVELNAHTFTNPEHALDGLQEFSHLWLIYHFHKNVTHAKAKVAPPRLCGERVGVFSTRSPHRPAPIGLSLVEIERIDGAKISFYGTDMVDGTPVLDIKPYIPHYDAPNVDASANLPLVPQDVTFDFYDSRQEPDGEESEFETKNGSNSSNTMTINGSGNGIACASSSLGTQMQLDTGIAKTAVRVPNWVMPSAQKNLNVQFNEHAEEQLNSLQVDRLSIIDILQTDPRSVYLRTKYGSQIFTFQLSEVNVTCKFDDKAATVTVVQIRPKEQLNHNSATVDGVNGGGAEEVAELACDKQNHHSDEVSASALTKDSE